jgi:ABC-type multidrug transport system ATPase subunit
VTGEVGVAGGAYPAPTPAPGPAQAVIRARALERRFGAKRVLGGLDLELERGGFLAVTGPNGSGKSTLLALFAGLLAPTAGSLEVAAERREIGYLAHEPLVYRELTPLENLDLYGRLYRVPERRERIGMLLERFGLWEARHERVGALSRGTAQRLALCRTLLHDPRLLLLDEPYAGLDEAGGRLLDDELRGLAGERTLAVATHAPGRVASFTTAELALA